MLDETVDHVAAAVLALIDIPGPDRQRRVLSHALVGAGEAVARKELTGDGSDVDTDELTRWIVELVWYGLRGVRAHGVDTPVA